MQTIKDNVIKPNLSMQERLRQEHLPVGACFQCRKCSSGCPLTFAMDLMPDRVIRLALLGAQDQVLGSNTIWVCSSCETCTTRCPNGIDIAGVMDWLKEEALKRGLAVPQTEVAGFHRAFLRTIRFSGGRLSEPVLMGFFALSKFRRKFDPEDMRQNLQLGLKLWRRGRLRLPRLHGLKGRQELNKIFRDAGI